MACGRAVGERSPRPAAQVNEEARLLVLEQLLQCVLEAITHRMGRGARPLMETYDSDSDECRPGIALRLAASCRAGIESRIPRLHSPRPAASAAPE